jgi:adenylate cyclase
MPAQILVVDDEVDLELLVTQRFRREIRSGEFRFLFAHDGIEALSVIEKVPDIDLVLSDINMPRMDGLTFLDRLSELDEDMKTVIVSAYGDMGNIRIAMNRGAFDFLTKPIAFDDLSAIIQKALGQVQRVREIRRARGNATRISCGSAPSAGSAASSLPTWPISRRWSRVPSRPTSCRS